MPKQILIVDDNDETRDLVRMTLDGEGYDLHEAQDGWEALEVARRVRPDLVLLDVMMPGGKNGFQVCGEIKADPTLAHTRVVLVTAVRDFQGDTMRRRVAADGHIMKPFSTADLVDKVAYYLQV